MADDVVNTEETVEDKVRRYAGKMVALRALHAPRRLDGDGFTNVWCRECRQNFPCPTMEVVGV